MKRIYVHIDNLKPLIDWLKTKPEGELRVLIGGKDNATPELMKAITREGRSFAQWVVAKMQAGELKVASQASKSEELEAGKVYED